MSESDIIEEHIISAKTEFSSPLNNFIIKEKHQLLKKSIDKISQAVLKMQEMKLEGT